jgi:hypothetical protein
MASDPDQIRGSIEQTQQDLSADVDALAEKVSPPRIAERQVQRTRSTITNLKDRIMGTTAEHASTMGGTVSSSASSARETLTAKASSAADMAGSAPEIARQRARGNPLAAGLIAFGAGWLVSSLLPATEPEQQVASQVKDLAMEKGRPGAQQLSQAGQQIGQELRESAQQRAEAVKETAASAASAVTDEAQSRASDVASHAQQAGTTVTDQARPGPS